MPYNSKQLKSPLIPLKKEAMIDYKIIATVKTTFDLFDMECKKTKKSLEYVK